MWGNGSGLDWGAGVTAGGCEALADQVTRRQGVRVVGAGQGQKSPLLTQPCGYQGLLVRECVPSGSAHPGGSCVWGLWHRNSPPTTHAGPRTLQIASILCVHMAFTNNRLCCALLCSRFPSLTLTGDGHTLSLSLLTLCAVLPAMILLQVHLQQPCYDFCFL